MPRIDTPEQLLEVLGEVFASEDPIAALGDRGVELSDDLRRQIEEGSSQRPSQEEIRRALRRAEGLRSVAFQAGELAFVTEKAAGGSIYDMVFAVQMSLLDEVLAGLFATHTVPHAVTLRDEIDSSQLSLLETLLRTTFEDFPETPGVSLGDFRFTAPPTVSPVQATKHILLHIPFSLGLERPGFSFFFGPAPRQEVTSIDGTVSFGMRVASEVNADGVTLGLGSIGGLLPLGAPERLNIEISATSPLQPRSDQSLDALELLLGGAVQDLIESIAQTWTICPRFNIPLADLLVDGASPGFELAIQLVDVRAVESSGGYLGVGILAGSEPLPEGLEVSAQADLEDPSFTFDGSNLHACVAEKFVRKIVRMALESGDLEEVARAEKSNIRIKDADANFKPGQIEFRIKGKAVDECPLNKDFHFDGKIVLELDGVIDGKLLYKVDNTIGFGDGDLGDQILCFVLKFLQLFLPILNLVLVFKFGRFLWGKIFGSSGGFDSVGVVFDPRELIPGTELMPEVEVTEATIDTTQLRVSAMTRLKPDTINTHVYAAFEVQRAMPPFMREPAVGATVQLKDTGRPAAHRG